MRQISYFCSYFVVLQHKNKNKMPRKDIYHDCVVKALEKEGWVITHDPLNLTVDDTPLFADLGAEAVFVAERKGERIAVEIKTFGRASFVTAFHEAVGKYIIYRNVLKIIQPERILYLAIPESIYTRFFEETVGAAFAVSDPSSPSFFTIRFLPIGRTDY